ncbi:regulatory protein, luxR family [Ectothiorhodospira magna]|uniref:Regulatory protein, luxR family n=1 Tax=Ectothiorhodospira magna TaxID=867345 RepID=A0A1H9CCG2_9GAMM|nr:LuxR family transcriptional regulator [Ectothiorhodospira magna]SEP98378.1 regulatory protein, luxR family [Ectothiorhodospira magna]
MTLARQQVQPIFNASLYIVWLIMLPMSGALLTQEHLMPWFLASHVIAVIALGTLGHRLAPVFLEKVVRFGVITTAGLSLLALELQGHGTGCLVLMLMLGITSAPVSLRMLEYLRCCQRPVPPAALALAGGNGLALALILAPLSLQLKLALVSVLLLCLLPRPQPPSMAQTDQVGHMGQLYIYLPFIFVFQIVAGLMYGGMIPAYETHAIVPGLEIIFYGIGALGCLWLLRHTYPVAMLVGVLVALVAFGLWSLLPAGAGIHSAMFLMMLGAGIVDLLMLSLVLTRTDLIRAFGLGVGTLCAGILMGKLLALILGGAAETTAFIALVLLNMAVLTLFFPWAKKHDIPTDKPAPPNGPDTRATVELPGHFATLLSEKEQQVLLLVLMDKTYREVAHTLAISESSVKTYMHRIFQKTGVYRRHQLLALIRQSNAVSQPSSDPNPG